MPSSTTFGRIKGSSIRAAGDRSIRSWSVWCCVGLTCCGLLADLAQSEESATTRKAGVLLLEGNRVVLGRITPQGDTYSVEQSAGTLVVSRQQVSFVGADLNEVYVHLQDSLPKPSAANDHVELARWCVGYRLLPEARFELQAALEVDPSRDDIRRNLNQLDSLLKRPVTTEAKPVKSETPAQRMAKLTGMTGNDVESLGGLSRAAGQEFTRRIQPMLMHNCTASACHAAASDQTLKLSLVRQGTSLLRSTTEKNLLALLPYIDREDPKSGKLWKLLKTNHGAKGSSIFLGTKGQEQLTAFQDWLLALEETDVDEPRAAKTRSAAQVPKTAQSGEQKPRYRKGEHAPPVAREESEEPAPEGAVTKPRTSSKIKVAATKTAPAPAPDTESIVSENPPELPEAVAEDPFNPDEFNRQQRVKKVYGAQ